MSAIALDPERAVLLANDPRWIHYIGIVGRVGVYAFAVFLEHRHFKPGTPANDDFQLGFQQWENMRWMIVSIPQSLSHLAEGELKPLGLRVGNGVPHVLSSAGVQKFPVFDNERCFTLEYVPGHFEYQNNPSAERAALAAEFEAVDSFVKQFHEGRGDA